MALPYRARAVLHVVSGGRRTIEVASSAERIPHRPLRLDGRNTGSSGSERNDAKYPVSICRGSYDGLGRRSRELCQTIDGCAGDGFIADLGDELLRSIGLLSANHLGKQD
jgi:hypothetical protein